MLLLLVALAHYCKIHIILLDLQYTSKELSVQQAITSFIALEMKPFLPELEVTLDVSSEPDLDALARMNRNRPDVVMMCDLGPDYSNIKDPAAPQKLAVHTMRNRLKWPKTLFAFTVAKSAYFLSHDQLAMATSGDEDAAGFYVGMKEPGLNDLLAATASAIKNHSPTLQLK